MGGIALGALPWLGALGAVAALVCLIVYWPLRLDVSAQARGEADGSWLIAGGVSLAGVSFTLVSARGVPLQLSLLLFGKKLSFKAGWGRKLRRPAVPKRVKSISKRLWSRIDPLPLALKLLDERRHVRLRYLVVDLTYGFRDPVLTGRLVGALSLLALVLPAPIEVRHSPRWDLEDGWEIAVDGRAIVRPWLALLDVLAYVVRQLSHERQQDLRSRPEPAQGRAGGL